MNGKGRWSGALDLGWGSRSLGAGVKGWGSCMFYQEAAVGEDRGGGFLCCPSPSQTLSPAWQS